MLFQFQVLLMSVFAFSLPGEDTVARSSYECGVGGYNPDGEEEEEEEEEEELKTYCLAKCEGRETFRPVTGELDPVDYSDDWCENKAREYCHKYGLDLAGSCFGERID